MSLEEIRTLVEQYFAWLKDKTTLKAIDENWMEVTTPLLDRHNDFLQIYIRKEGQRFLLSDDGYVLADLEQSGCSIDSQKRQQLLKVTLNGFGVREEKGRLEVLATREDFARRKHNLLQAMLAVNDLFYVARPYVTSLFYEEVVSWLDLMEVRYTANKKVTGKSGFDHMFSFIIPKSKAKPERFVQAVSNPNRAAAEKLITAWFDIQETVEDNARAFAILNDSDDRIKAGVPEALLNYDIKPIPWTMRDEAREMLTA